MDVFDLVAKITLDSSEYEKGLGDAEKSASKWGQGLQTATSVAKGVGVAITAVTTAAVAAGGAFIKGASEVATYGDNIDKMSQKMGISAQAYQEWDAILRHNGSSIDSMSRGMQTLQKNAVNSTEKFKKLGITQEQIASMSTEELFSATVKGLQGMGEGAERTALASELLGASAKELGPLLNMTAEETEQMRQRVHELGGVMSDEAVEASARYADSLQDMQTAFDGIKRNLLAEFLPAISDTMDGLGNLFSGNSDVGLGQIQNGISGIIQNMTAAIPRFIEIGSAIISALGQAIMQNLPRLLEMGLQVIVQLAQGISQSLPTLIPAVISIILEMVNTLASNANMLAEAAVQLAIGLAQGLINAIPQILMAIPQIIASLGNALIHGLREILGPVGDFLFGEVDVIGQETADKAGQWGGQIENGFYTPQGGQPGSAGWSGNVYGVVDSTGQNAQQSAQTWGGKIESSFYEGNGGSTDGGWSSNVIEYVEETGEETKRVVMRKSEETGRVYWEVLNDSTPDSTSSGLVTGTEALMEAAKQAALGKAAEMDEPGQEAVVNMLAGYSGKAPEYYDLVVDTMQKGKTEADSWATQMAEPGELSVITLTSGMENNRDAPINSMGDLVRDSYENGLTIAAGAKVVGTALASHAASGTTSSSGLVSSAARSVVSSAISQARGEAGKSDGVGRQIGSGIAGGITAMAQRIASAATSVVSQALNAAKQRAAIASPSKVFRDEVGKMLTLGIAEGMVSKDVLRELDKSAEELTGDTVKDLETLVRAWDAVYDNYFEGLEHQNFFLELAGDTDAIIANYRKMQETLHEQKLHYLAMGVDANDSAIRDMEEQWWTYQHKIEGIYTDIAETTAKTAEEAFEGMSDVLEHKLFLAEKNGKSPEERLTILQQLMEETHKRADELRRQGYTDESKEIRSLQKQWWGYYDEFTDINNDIADEIAKRNEKIANAFKESGDGIVDAFEQIAREAQEAYDQAFDAILQKQNAMADSLSQYGELYKSTVLPSGKTYVSLQDLDKQAKTLEKYGEIIENLRSRGVSGGLMEQILGMGVDEGSAFGMRLLNMSDQGLADYLASYAHKQDVAADIAARYYKPEFDTLNGQNFELVSQQNLEYNAEQVSLLRRMTEAVENGNGQTVQIVVDGQTIANATFDDLIAVGRARGMDIVNVREG